MAPKERGNETNERGNDEIAEQRSAQRNASAETNGSRPAQDFGLRVPAMFDMLSASRFWLYDVAPIDGLSLPLFQPLSGFSAITAPEVTAETQEINEANALFPTKIIKSATTGSITLTRGASFYNADFYNWMMSALRGVSGTGVTYRRDLMLIHFFRNFGIGGRPTSDKALRTATAAAASAGINAVIAATKFSAGSIYGMAQQAGFALLTGTVKVPARAFLLKGCIPIRYKSGSDFDAASSDISIQELELDVHSWDEISLGAV